MKKTEMIEQNQLEVVNGTEEQVKGEMSIVDSLASILKASFHSELTDECLTAMRPELDYLKERLNITSMQALIIGMLIDSNDRLRTKNMASYLGINNLTFLKHSDELEELVSRKIIRKNSHPGENGTYYQIREEAQRAYLQDECYDGPNLRFNLPDFVDAVYKLIERCKEDEISKKEMDEELHEMIELNQQLFICRGLERLSCNETFFYFYCLTQFVMENDTSIHTMEICSMCNAMIARHLSTSLETGKSPLITEHLLEPAGANEFSDNNQFTLGEALRNQLMVELNLEPIDNSENARKGLRLHQSITAKQLFYNSAEHQSIAELTQLLTEERFAQIQERLVQHGMRKGFACLFYGAPGTGKTESVLQLARATGRDIMEVNIASIKSKWVGDSEKNIKQIFSRYRNYCENCAIQPILLFNEADAIISKRSTNVERSVDKMENAMQNIILEEMEKLDGILIATTNLTSNMDAAFERRFLYKVEFKKPEVEAKSQIWKSMVQELEENDAYALAKSYDFSGGQIENIARKVVINNILHDTPITLEQIKEFCNSESLHKEDKYSKKIGFC